MAYDPVCYSVRVVLFFFPFSLSLSVNFCFISVTLGAVFSEQESRYHSITVISRVLELVGIGYHFQRDSNESLAAYLIARIPSIT